MHSWLHLPVASLWSPTADTDSEILIEDGLRVVAEGTHELAPHDGRVIEEAYRSTTLVSQALTKVHKDMALPTLIKGKGRQGRA